MKANFDGMRRSATRDMNDLHTTLKELIELDEYDGINEELKERIVETYNNAAQSVGAMNCLYDPAVEGDMNDLSDVLSIDRLELSEDKDDDE